MLASVPRRPALRHNTQESRQRQRRPSPSAHRDRRASPDAAAPRPRPRRAARRPPPHAVGGPRYDATDVRRDGGRRPPVGRSSRRVLLGPLYREVERSLHQIWFFIFVFVALCLLLFWLWSRAARLRMSPSDCSFPSFLKILFIFFIIRDTS